MKKLFDVTDEGHTFDIREMENGECRIRVSSPDGAAYIRTEASSEGAWQNAHHHKGVLETYVVQKGWIAVAEVVSTAYWRVRVFREGQVFTSQPEVDHNVYMPADSVIHTVQHGRVVSNPDNRSGKDWYPAATDFDHWSKGLSIEDIAEEASDCTILTNVVVHGESTYE